jgi:Bacterial SH3 domain
LNNTARLSAALAFGAVSLAGIGAGAQMSPIRHHPFTPATAADEPAAATPASAPASQPPSAQPAVASEATPSLPAAQPTAASEATLSASVPIAVDPAGGISTPAHMVFLRSGPNTASQVIGTLQPGMQLRVLASANYGWKQVSSPVGTGWTYGNYLAP